MISRLLVCLEEITAIKIPPITAGSPNRPEDRERYAQRANNIPKFHLRLRGSCKENIRKLKIVNIIIKKNWDWNETNKDVHEKGTANTKPIEMAKKADEGKFHCGENNLKTSATVAEQRNALATMINCGSHISLAPNNSNEKILGIRIRCSL